MEKKSIFMLVEGGGGGGGGGGFRATQHPKLFEFSSIFFFFLENLNFSHQGCHFWKNAFMLKLSWIVLIINCLHPQKIWEPSQLNFRRISRSDRGTDRKTG